MAEMPSSRVLPPPYELRAQSQDDSVLISSLTRDRRTLPTPYRETVSTTTTPRDRSGIYESIKERTEPENSLSSSDSDPESVPVPKLRMHRSKRKELGEVPPVPARNSRDLPAIMSASCSSRGNNADTPRSVTSSLSINPGCELYSPRDSGILDDRSSSHGNSLENSINITSFDGAQSNNLNSSSNGHHNTGSHKSNGVSIGGLNSSHNGSLSNSGGGGSLSRLRSGGSLHPDDQRIGIGVTRGDLALHLDRSSNLTSSGRGKDGKQGKVPGSQFYTRENSQGELQVRKRSRGERDRLRQLRQGK